MGEPRIKVPAGSTSSPILLRGLETASNWLETFLLSLKMLKSEELGSASLDTTPSSRLDRGAVARSEATVGIRMPRGEEVNVPMAVLAESSYEHQVLLLEK